MQPVAGSERDGLCVRASAAALAETGARPADDIQYACDLAEAIGRGCEPLSKKENKKINLDSSSRARTISSLRLRFFESGSELITEGKAAGVS